MTETDLHFFIDSTLNYFEETTGIAAKPGIPFLKRQEPVVLQFSGIIGISGRRKGCIYITADATMLYKLSEKILGCTDVAVESLEDLIGEIANTISGNVRQAYGSSFMISVPVVVQGDTRDIKLPGHLTAFVVPFAWEGFKSYLVVCIE